jgi:hypothetical protein
LRTLVEAFVDLEAVVADETHVDVMEVTALHQKRKILESAVERDIPSKFLGRIAKYAEAADQLESVRSRLAELKARGIGRLRQPERFRRAGALDFYEGPYALLCDHAHNNVNVLASRHFREVEDNPTVFFTSPMTDEEVLLVVDTACGMSARSAQDVKRLIEGPDPEGLEPLAAAIEQLRANWIASSPADDA